MIVTSEFDRYSIRQLAVGILFLKERLLSAARLIRGLHVCSFVVNVEIIWTDMCIKLWQNSKSFDMRNRSVQSSDSRAQMILG